ncbi:MAG: Mu transposase C-terminal domain-containing protein [Methylocella sp.]
MSQNVSRFFCEEYNLTPHGTTKVAPLARWSCDAFLPRMPDSLEQLDLLLLTVSKERVVRPDGIHFMGMRYIDPLLAAYVQERVLLRYDPRDMAEVRVFHQDMFLCRAVCQELAGETVPLKEIMNARDRQRRALRATLDDRRKQVASLLEARHFQTPDADVAPDIVPLSPNKLKRYRNE